MQCCILYRCVDEEKFDIAVEPFGRPTLSLSSPYATLLLTPGKLLSIQTFLEGQSVIPVLRILLCLQHKHMMNNLTGKYVFIWLGTLIPLLDMTSDKIFTIFKRWQKQTSLEGVPNNEVKDDKEMQILSGKTLSFVQPKHAKPKQKTLCWTYF